MTFEVSLTPITTGASGSSTATGANESNPEVNNLWEQQEKEKAEAKKQQEISRIKSEVSANASSAVTNASQNITVPIAGTAASKPDFNEGLLFSGISGDADAMAEVKSDSGFISSLKSMWESAKQKLSPKQEQPAGPITSTNKKLLDRKNKQRVAHLKNEFIDSYYKTQAKLSDTNNDLAEKTKLVDTPIKSTAPSFGLQINKTKEETDTSKGIMPLEGSLQATGSVMTTPGSLLTKAGQTDFPSDINNITPEQLAEFAKAQGLEYTPPTNSTDGIPAEVAAILAETEAAQGITMGSNAKEGKTISTEQKEIALNNMNDLEKQTKEIVSKLSDPKLSSTERESLMKELDTITTKSAQLIGETPKTEGAPMLNDNTFDAIINLSPEDQQAMTSYMEAQIAAGKGLDTDDEGFKKLSPDAQKALMALSADVSSKATEKN